jgi:hypothetical protein
LTLSYCQIAKIVVANPSLLHREAFGGRGGTIKVHIDCTRDDGKWTMSARIWHHGTYRNDDEFDDDINTGHWSETRLVGVVLEDVWEAMQAKEDIVDFINSARQRECPIEHAIAAAGEDLQEDYGKGGAIGYHSSEGWQS